MSEATARWAAARPPCLKDPALFESWDPLFSSRPEVFERALRALLAAYTTGTEAASAVLRWLAAGAGPWSGYPSYEGVAERLLVSIGGAAILDAVLAQPGDAELELAAARYFSSWEVTRSRRAERDAVPAPLRARLRARVAAQGLDDNLRRFDAAFAPLAAPRPPKGDAQLVGRTRNGPARGVCPAADGWVFALDAHDVVAFGPDSASPRVLCRPESTFVYLAADATHLWMVLGKPDGLARVSRDGGPVERVADDLVCPIWIAAHGRYVYWHEKLTVTHPTLGAPYAAFEARLRRLATDSHTASPELVSHVRSSAWDVTPTALGVILATGPLDTETTVVRGVARPGGPAHELAVLPRNTRIAATDEHLYWYDSSDERLVRWSLTEQRAELRTHCKPPSATLCAGPGGLVFWHAGRKDKKTLYWLPRDEERPRELATWRSPPYDRPEPVVVGNRVFYATDDAIYAIALG